MKKVFLENLPRFESGGHKGQVNWMESIGKEVNFIFESVKGTIKIIDYNSSKNKLLIEYKNRRKSCSTNSFHNAYIKKLVFEKGVVYKWEIGETIDTLKTGKITILNRSIINGLKHYEYHCSKCKDIDIIKESALLKGKGCKVCTVPSRKVLMGYNDLWTTHPEIAVLLKYKEIGYVTSSGSGKRFEFVCPDCEFETSKSLSVVKRHGFSCPHCSDGISYPEKIMMSILNQLNINYRKEEKFSWSQNKRYDFYIPSLKCIVETHGEQHYNKTFENIGGKTLAKEKQNDKLKFDMAKQNGIINYFTINCMESDLDYIRENVYKSEISKLIDLSLVNWEECNLFACKSLIKETWDLWNSGIKKVSEIASMQNLSGGTIREYLKQGVKCGICKYDPKQSLSKKVVQLTYDNKVIGEWNSASKAQEETRINATSILNACKGSQKQAGKYLWMYKKDYERLVKDLKPFKKEPINNKPVIQLTKDGIFIKEWSSAKSADKETKANSNVISKCCKGSLRTSGGFRWMYKEDYERVEGKINEMPMGNYPQIKKVVQLSMENEFVREWDSIKEAASSVGAIGANISRVCKRGARSVKGYKWMYKEDYDNYGALWLDKYLETKIHPRSIPVVQLTLTNEYIREWNSAKEVGEKLGLGNSSVTSACKGKQKTSNGYKWMYKKDYDEMISQNLTNQ